MSELGTVLVTGATGEIGGALLGRLLPRAEVRVLSRRPRPSSGTARWIAGDLRDPGSLARACDGADRVLHMAALTHSRRRAAYYRVNTDGTANLLRAAADAEVRRFVHVSTRAIGADGGAYSHSKELAERQVEASGLPWVILRPAEVYGGGRDPIAGLARALAERAFAPILGDGGARLSPVHVDDLTPALVAALDRDRAEGQRYVLAGPEEMTYLELVVRLERILGLPPRRRVHVPLAAARLAIGLANLLSVGGYVPDQIPRLLLPKSSDVSAAVRDLGFSPRSLEDGVAALRDAGRLNAGRLAA